MNDKFILLNTTDKNSVIIGLSNIAYIEAEDPKKENSECKIVLNFARNQDLWPKSILVLESFDQIKSKLGL